VTHDRAGIPARSAERLSRLILATLWAVLALAAVDAAQHGSITGRPRVEVALALALAALLVWVVRRLRAPIESLPAGWFLVLSLTAVVLPRLLWVLWVPTVPVSDYAGYTEAARAIVAGLPQHAPRQTLGEVAQLAATFALTGGSLVAARVVNVALAALTALGLLALARRTLGEGTARWAVLLYAVWPADIALRGVFATEHGFVVCLLPALAIAIDVARARDRVLVRAGLVGGLLAVAQAYRPVGSVVLVVLAAWWLATWRRPTRRQLAAVAVAVAVFAVGGLARAGLAHVLGFTSPKSTLGMNLLAGTNVASRGTWTRDDFDLLEGMRAEVGPASSRVVRAAAAVAWRRIVSEPVAFARLQFDKIDVMWGNEVYGIYWSTRSLDDGRAADSVRAWVATLSAWSQYAWAMLLLLVLAGARRCLAERAHGALVLGPLVVLVFIGLHVVLEVQSRYHHPWVLLLLPLAAHACRQRPRLGRGETDPR